MAHGRAPRDRTGKPSDDECLIDFLSTASENDGSWSCEETLDVLWWVSPTWLSSDDRSVLFGGIRADWLVDDVHRGESSAWRLPSPLSEKATTAVDFLSSLPTDEPDGSVIATVCETLDSILPMSELREAKIAVDRSEAEAERSQTLAEQTLKENKTEAATASVLNAVQVASASLESRRSREYEESAKQRMRLEAVSQSRDEAAGTMTVSEEKATRESRWRRLRTCSCA